MKQTVGADSRHLVGHDVDIHDINDLRVFRDAGLGGIAAFIKAEQLQRALWLLRNTDQPISEIARASGFISTTHFSTFIRKRVGRPPRELR